MRPYRLDKNNEILLATEVWYTNGSKIPKANLPQFGFVILINAYCGKGITQILTNDRYNSCRQQFSVIVM
jgi:hypothetical protein